MSMENPVNKVLDPSQLTRLSAIENLPQKVFEIAHKLAPGKEASIFRTALREALVNELSSDDHELVETALNDNNWRMSVFEITNELIAAHSNSDRSDLASQPVDISNPPSLETTAEDLQPVTSWSDTDQPELVRDDQGNWVMKKYL